MLCLTAPEGRAAPRVARAANTALAAAPSYARHVPERTLLYALVQAHYPDFIVRLEAEDRPLPEYVREEFETYLRCGVLEHGFLRVVCEHCRAERLVAYSCKKRGLCPSCGARRMAESARHLVDTDMRGHNRPPFPPKIPGTDLPSWDVPTAIIYRPARSAMTSAPRPNYWVLA